MLNPSWKPHRKIIAAKTIFSPGSLFKRLTERLTERWLCFKLLSGKIKRLKTILSFCFIWFYLKFCGLNYRFGSILLPTFPKAPITKMIILTFKINQDRYIYHKKPSQVMLNYITVFGKLYWYKFWLYQSTVRHAI